MRHFAPRFRRPPTASSVVCRARTWWRPAPHRRQPRDGQPARHCEATGERLYEGSAISAVIVVSAFEVRAQRADRLAAMAHGGLAVADLGERPAEWRIEKNRIVAEAAL